MVRQAHHERTYEEIREAVLVHVGRILDGFERRDRPYFELERRWMSSLRLLRPL